ncbi:MAG: AraC family transcriptional regulator [Pseudomonadota bacterium]
MPIFDPVVADENTARWLDILPQGPTCSSAALGWRHLAAYRFDGLRCWELDLPAVRHHFISAHLLRPCHVDTRWSGRSLRGRSLPGNAMLMAAGQDSSWHCSTAMDELQVFLDPDVVNEVATEIGVPSYDLIEGVGIVDPVIREISLQLLAEIENPGIGTRLFGDTMARTLALHLLRRHSTAAASAPPRRIDMTARQLRAATDFIESQLDQDLSLESISAASAMSPFRFARAFKKATGQSPLQYVIHRRIDRAKELLRSGDRDLADIANLVGFSTQSHFTAVFRRRCGTTPKRYRDLCCA